MVELAGGTLVSALRALDELRAAPAGMPAPDASPANDVPAAARHVVLGAIVTTPRALAGALARAGRVAAPAWQIAGRAGRLLGRVPGAGLARGRWETLRARAGTELAAWAAVGQQEEAAGQSLARAAVAGFFELAIARVAESPDLKRVIEEQSQGVDGGRGDRAARALPSGRQRGGGVRETVHSVSSERVQMTAGAIATTRRAGLVTRGSAFVLDALVLLVLLRGSVWLLDASARLLRRFAPPVDLGKIFIAVVPLLVAAYLVLLWRAFGQTPGKWVMGVKIVPVEGGPLKITRAVVRLFGYLVSALPFYLGFLWMLGPRRRGWHDLLARTEVIYVPRRRPAPRRETRWVPGSQRQLASRA